MSPKPVPLAVELYRKVGFRKGTKALEFVVAFGLLYEQLGEAPTMAQYIEHWKMSVAGGYRDRDAWVAAVGDRDPLEVWLAARDRVEERKDRKIALMQMMAVVV